MVSLAAEISYRPCDQRTCRVDILLSRCMDFSFHLYTERCKDFDNHLFLKFYKFVNIAQNSFLAFVYILLCGY